jgi:hypothetical protein
MVAQVIHFAHADFRNDDRVFGIKQEDRFSHLYIIGKTGTGKSTLIETIALQDLERGNGFALIDPHGDLVARVAARILMSQQDKVIYLNATDPTQPYGYNPLRHGAKPSRCRHEPENTSARQHGRRARRLAHAAVQWCCRPCPLGTCPLLRHRETLSSRCPGHGNAGADQSRGFRLRGYHEPVQQVTWM